MGCYELCPQGACGTAAVAPAPEEAADSSEPGVVLPKRLTQQQQCGEA